MSKGRGFHRQDLQEMCSPIRSDRKLPICVSKYKLNNVHVYMNMFFLIWKCVWVVLRSTIPSNITLLQEVLDTLLIDGAFTVNCSIFSLNFSLKTRCQSNLIQNNIVRVAINNIFDTESLSYVKLLLAQAFSL